MSIKKWMLWVSTIALILLAVYFFVWAIQTAWLGSFPGRDKSKYTVWFILQLCGAVISLLIAVFLWVGYWKSEDLEK